MEDGVPTIGVICGCDRATNIVWEYAERTHSIGNNDSLAMLKYLEPAVKLHRMHIAPSYFRQVRRWHFRDCDLVWNAISDEIQNQKTLAIAQKLMTESKLPIVNAPALIPRTSRFETARRLIGIDGVLVPKVLVLRNPTLERVGRMVRDRDFAFPAIVRRTGTHNGEVVGRFDRLEDLEPIFGDRKNEYNLIEFVDVRPPDGFYRKTRFFFVGDQILTRQHIISDEWSVHGRSSRRLMADHPELRDEARDRLINGFASLPAATRRAIHEVRARIGLDYFGLDCAIKDSGEVVIFECNATMNFNPYFRNPATQHNRAAFPRMMEALRRLIEAKTGKCVTYHRTHPAMEYDMGDQAAEATNM